MFEKGLKLKVKTAGKALKSCIPEEGLSSECCGLKLTLEKSPNPQPRSSFRHRLIKITDRSQDLSSFKDIGVCRLQ